MDFFVKYLPEILLSLITAAALGFCRYMLKQIKNYKKLLSEQNKEDINNLISAGLEPIVGEIKELKDAIVQIQDNHNLQLQAIIRYYRFNLVQLCKIYLEQGHLTPAQFEQLSEFYKFYHDLGGNGQAQDYYEKTMKLPVIDENEIRK